MKSLWYLVQRSGMNSPSTSTFRRGFYVPAHWRYTLPHARAEPFGTQRSLSTTPRRADEAALSSLESKSPKGHDKAAFKTEEPRLSLTFTCTVTACGTRSSHTFTRRSYKTGIVIVQCPGCKNRHLIADHLGWFKESTEEGRLKTIEDLMRAKGEKVTRGVLDTDGVVEYTPE